MTKVQVFSSPFLVPGDAQCEIYVHALLNPYWSHFGKTHMTPEGSESRLWSKWLNLFFPNVSWFRVSGLGRQPISASFIVPRSSVSSTQCTYKPTSCKDFVSARLSLVCLAGGASCDSGSSGPTSDGPWTRPSDIDGSLAKAGTTMIDKKPHYGYPCIPISPTRSIPRFGFEFH